LVGVRVRERILVGVRTRHRIWVRVRARYRICVSVRDYGLFEKSKKIKGISNFFKKAPFKKDFQKVRKN